MSSYPLLGSRRASSTAWHRLPLLLAACCTLLAVAPASAQDCSNVCIDRILSTSSPKGDPCVKHAQLMLKLSADGSFGPKTKKAVEAFQNRLSLELVPDIEPKGKVGPVTWDTLLGACTEAQAPACTPTRVALPNWQGGLPEQLACAVKDLATSFGLNMAEQWGYIMGTVARETGGTYMPLREGGEAVSEDWRKAKFRYFPYYGRGYVQLTHLGHYRKYSNLLGGDCDMVTNTCLALRPDISLYVLVQGMATGGFTGRKLSTFINPTRVDWIEARSVVNGKVNGMWDAADIIATAAKDWSNRYSTLTC